MTARIRTIQFVVQPVVVIDDGDSLTPVQVEPITVAGTDIDGFADSYRAQVAEQERALHEQPAN